MDVRTGGGITKYEDGAFKVVEGSDGSTILCVSQGSWAGSDDDWT